MKRQKYFYFFIIIACLFFIIFLLKQYQRTDDTLVIHVLDIGQGDAIYIKLPNDVDMLIDSGRDRSIMHLLGRIIPDNHIDIIEISNPDLDHIGGIPFVLDRYSVSKILSPGTNHESSDAFKEIQKIVQDKKIPVQRPKSGDVYLLDKERNITYTILWPEGNVREWERNSGSMVGLLQYGNKKILLTGDAPKEVEDQIISQNKEILSNIEILKVGHHGSRTSTGQKLAQIAKPKYSLISAGKNNRYGHPHKEVMDMLLSVKSQILITSDHGTITCYISPAKETLCK